MSKMKKFFVLGLGVALCFALVAGASAFEGASLEKQTTFGLYDRSDPFDISIDPGLLYQVDRWRLYTNLSNYEGTPDYDMDYCRACTSSGGDPCDYNGAYYMIGTSGKLGPGSVALLYETNKLEFDDDGSSSSYSGYNYLDPDPSPAIRMYTGTDDYTSEYSSSWNDKSEIERHNFHVSYGMDFGIWSLGLAYSPEFTDATNSLDASTWSYSRYMFDYGPSYSYAFYNDYSAYYGDNGTYDQAYTYYGNVDHTKFRRNSYDYSQDGDEDIEERNHVLTLGSMIRPADHYDIQVTATYENVDRDMDGTLTYVRNEEVRQEGEIAGDAGEFPGNPNSWDSYSAGYLQQSTMTSTWDGTFNFCGLDNRDGDIWGLKVRPTYHVNDIVALDLELGYEDGNGDLSGDYTQRVTYQRTLRTAAGAATSIETADEFYDNTFSGDWDRTHWSVEPRVYLTYGAVEFSLGVGYSYLKEEENYRQWETATSTFSYDNGVDVDDDTNDWTATAGRTSYYDYDGEYKTTSWSFPVATRFKVTDKLTLRAGARFTRMNFDDKYKYSDVNYTDESFEATNGAGDKIAGPEYQVDADGNVTPYDYDTSTSRSSSKYDDTVDISEYRLGLGYQVTENLTFDLMFKETASDGDTGDPHGRGGVDARTVWGSVVLAF
jgi:hypothetical protein